MIISVPLSYQNLTTGGCCDWSVFTLSSSFPMLSITLRNNLDTLIQHVSQKGDTQITYRLVCKLLLQNQWESHIKLSLLYMRFNIWNVCLHEVVLEQRTDFVGLGTVMHGNSSSDTVASTLQSKNGYRRILLTLLAVVPPTILSYIAEVSHYSFQSRFTCVLLSLPQGERHLAMVWKRRKFWCPMKMRHVINAIVL